MSWYDRMLGRAENKPPIKDHWPSLMPMDFPPEWHYVPISLEEWVDQQPKTPEPRGLEVGEQ